MLLSSSDTAASILVSAQRELGFNMYAEYAQLAINFPCIISMAIHDSQRHPCAQY